MILLILDTTVISNFAHARRPELLALALEGRGVITPKVLEELRQGEALGYLPHLDWSWLEILLPTSEEESLAKSFLAQLDAGEAESLAVAIERNGVFLSDDLAARRLAQHYGIRVSGTLGLLLELMEAKHIDLMEGDRLLAVMITNGYRAPVSSLGELL